MKGVAPVNVNSSGVGLNTAQSLISYTNVPPTLPTNVIAWVGIKVNNAQSTSIATTTPVRITVNSNTFNSYLASNLKNVCFFDSSGTVLYSWLESGETNSSTSTVYWVLPSATIAANTTTTIYMGMAATTTALIDGVKVGAEPNWAGGTYGQYDNGATIFSFYDNFAGTTTSTTNWTITGTPTQSNGINLSATAYITQKTGTFNAQASVAETFGYASTASSGNGEWFEVENSTYNFGIDSTTTTNSVLPINYNGAVGVGTAYTASTSASHIHGLFGSSTGSYFAYDYTFMQSNLTTDYPQITSGAMIRLGGATNTATQFFQWTRVRPQLPNNDTNPTITASTVINNTSNPITLGTTFTQLASASFTPNASGIVLISAYGVMSSLTDATQLQLLNGSTVVETVAQADKIFAVVSGLTIGTPITINLKGQSASGTDTYRPTLITIEELY